jgi:hypothetical protein
MIGPHRIRKARLSCVTSKSTQDFGNNTLLMRSFLSYLSKRCKWALKGTRQSLWMGISHYWSHASGFPVVLSAVVSRPHLGSNERICPRCGSITGWSERISRSLVRLPISNLYADSKGVRNAKRREEGGTHESCRRLFRAKRCASKTTRFGLTVFSCAIACGRTALRRHNVRT